MEELYIIKTNVNPHFLSMYQATEFPEEQKKNFVGFLDRIAEQYKDINLPIMAITDDEGITVPDHISGGGKRIPTPGTSQDIADLIDKYRVGDGTIYRDHVIPIRAVVDFTNSTPEFLGAYKLLEEKYDVKMLEIMDVE